MQDATETSIEEIFSAYPPFMTAKEAADLLRVDPQTTRKLIERGELPGRKIGGRWIVFRDVLRQQIIEGVPIGDPEE